MAKFCRHFKLLADRLIQLSEKFVDDQVVNETANIVTFTPDLDWLASFRFLMHAEIEDFLESKAEENLLAIGARMANPPWIRASPELLPLAMLFRKEIPSIEILEPTKFSIYVKDLILSAKKAISENNGVKSSQFLLLSICAGKTPDEIDTILSASLNSYGKARGDIAHKSVTHSTTLQAPSAELVTANNLIRQLGIYFDVVS